LDAYALFEGKTGEPYLGILLTYDLEKEQAPHVTITATTARQDAAMRVGLVGAGNFAKGVLIPRLAKLKDVSLEAIATATGVSARGTATKYGIGKLFADSAALLQDTDVNAALVTTRHNHHASAVLQALRTGKHVFVEKPLCLNEE